MSDEIFFVEIWHNLCQELKSRYIRGLEPAPPTFLQIKLVLLHTEGFEERLTEQRIYLCAAKVSK